MRRRFTNISSVKFNIVDYLTIESLEDGLEVYFSNDIEYGIDGEGWRKLTAFKTIKIDTEHTVSFRGNLTHKGLKGIGTFTVNKNFNLKGNVMSMLFGDAGKNNYSLSGKSYAFYQLFYNCTTLKSISDNFLPATTLANSCYYAMFFGCTSLTTAPKLPATTLASYCYYAMFSSCTRLTTAPKLPATTLAESCYERMFSSCTRLTTAPKLPATTLAESCYERMFFGCTSLTTAPKLPATTLAESCYNYMFYGCSNLNYIKMLATDISASSCLNNWVYGVATTGTFVKNKNATWNVTGISGVPSGWTIQKV